MKVTKSKEELNKEFKEYIHSIKDSIDDLSYFICSACPTASITECSKSCMAKKTNSKLVKNLNKLNLIFEEYSKQ